MQQVSIVSNLPAFAYKEQICCWKAKVLFKSWLRKTRCFTANVNRSEYFELGHSDRFYHIRAVRDLSTFVTKSYENCPFYIKVTNSSILLHTSLAGRFRRALNQKCCKTHATLTRVNVSAWHVTLHHHILVISQEANVSLMIKVCFNSSKNECKRVYLDPVTSFRFQLFWVLYGFFIVSNIFCVILAPELRSQNTQDKINPAHGLM